MSRHVTPSLRPIVFAGIALLIFLAGFLSGAAPALAQSPPSVRSPAAPQPAAPPPALAIPRLTAAPEIADFAEMTPATERARELARVEGFVQRWPADGQPERMRTVAYIGYTADALHVVYLAFDPDPAALRAHLIRREDVFAVNDDAVELRLDTFGDARQSYYFVANPLGVQLDAAWPEVGGQYDESFDAVWHSRGQRTSQGFIVVMTIPFKSLRFRLDAAQSWGIYLGRWIPRTGEWTFWPRISNRQQSFLRQMARLEGLADLARGRGFQLIPYAGARAFRTIDARNAADPRIVRDASDPRAGIDAKVVLRDAFVLDLTANPDFSQVESDAPQITTNARFEVFFPEKRPFFLENAGFFQTPINLLFTRRVADPDVGARVTGRAGPWSIAWLGVDDRAPGAQLAADDPARDRRTWTSVARVSRGFSGQSSVGATVTDRRVAGRENTVGGVDARLRFGGVWTVDAQTVRSHHRSDPAASARTGSALILSASRTGRTLSTRTTFDARSPDFVTDLGFVPRTDVRELTQVVSVTDRPASTLNDWGPAVLMQRTWDYDGTPLEWRVRPSLAFNFRRSTTADVFADVSRVTLRPGDARNLTDAARFKPTTWGVTASTSPTPSWSVSSSLTLGRAINFSPAGVLAPDLGDYASGRLRVAWRPLTPLRIEHTWLRTRLDVRAGRGFTTDIVRSQWAWQFTREWSLRFIGQYDATAADPDRVSVAPRRNLNADVLLTRLINPWTALYVGVNSNQRDLELVEAAPDSRLLRRTADLRPDAWQVFIKWSQLLRW